MVELMSPVQDFTSLTAAIDAGADSVYFGVKWFNMRGGANNFTLEELPQVVKQAHDANVKTWFTLNSIIYDHEIERLRSLLEKVKEAKVDGVIAWDFAVLEICQELGLELHISTQASISNYNALKGFVKSYPNIKRVNLAREVTLDAIRNIVNKIKEEKLDVDIEVFVHGAMCVATSGRCFMSLDKFGKSANRGQCLQNCRRNYIVKDVEEGHEFEIGEDYVMSPNDLCAIEIIDKIIEAGVGALKIEGRNRSPEYVQVTTECYRETIDSGYKPEMMERLKTVYNRGFSTGHYLGKPMDKWSHEYGSKATHRKTYVGKVQNFYKKVNVADVLVEAEVINNNDTLLIQGPTTGAVEQKVESMEIDKIKVDKAPKGSIVSVKIKDLVRENDKVYLFSKVTSSA